MRADDKQMMLPLLEKINNAMFYSSCKTARAPLCAQYELASDMRMNASLCEEARTSCGAAFENIF